MVVVMTRPADILILSDNPPHVRRWTGILTGADARLWQGQSALLADAKVDVVVTDRIINSDELRQKKLCSQLEAGEIGVVRVGDRGPADVCLPSDCSPRELRLACQLLTEIVRLRRQQNRGRRVQRLLSELAKSDPLTGLPNRRAWEDELRDLVETHEPEAAGYCLAVLDLDHFKRVNERYGHTGGDDVLRHVGHQLNAAVNGDDFVARLGGDEFAILLAGCDLAETAAAIEGLRTSACEGSPHTQITASVGFAFTADLQAGGIDDLFHAADDALRQAKSTGRNRTIAADKHTPGPA